MTLAYLLNSYPMTSTTFIRREIAAIEAAGVPVKRFAVRHWAEPLVDPRDRAEQRSTEYLLTGHAAALIAMGICEACTHPLRLARAVPSLMRLIRAAGGGAIRHIGYLLQAVRLRRRCAELGIDHIHAHFSTNAAAVAMLCRLMGGPAYSFTVHGPDELVNPAANGIVEKAQHARDIIAISNYCRTRLMEVLPPAQSAHIATIPCGVDLAEFARPAEIAEDAGSLLCVGRLCPQKGQIEIPVALAASLKRFPELRIDLIGDGEDRTAIMARAAALDVADHVILHGWRSNDAVRSMLRVSRALLLPSHAEGLPIVIMEAFAMGRPVITTRIAAIPELVDETCGWLFDAGSAEGLQQAIADAMTADGAQLARMGAEGRRRIEQRHDLRDIAPRLIALFGTPPTR
ncbi:Glycosyltransferase involved in cell wall bisynthesis [Sphingomonas sp. YR710]|uniref:glycosyltransferase family 4 protein n=1 Tax=Sphingomonas sp. YR710 TaxID=1882773 RepID=UPI00088B1526|nr:glycosyltransferase family 4 protein [Sphingomonas sp. YR710]SDC32724.1 Glycosyltransferase involved in cell wall bisynthesis [Sphingomonas sp. YR710]